MIQSNKIKKDIIFSDFDFTFTAHPKTGDISVLKNEDALKNALKNALQTKFGERRFYQKKGSNVYYRLFDDISYIKATALKNDIEITINNIEPRCNIIDIDIKLDHDNNGYSVSIYYNTINNLETQTINLFLERVR